MTQPVRVGFGWSSQERAWVLYIISPGLELSELSVSWPEAVAPPSLLERYDTLAELGYAVVQGGPEAWEWSEVADDRGEVFLLAYAEVRPLTDREVTEQAALGPG
ncbi:DUF6303 family protein [Streptomyces antibioticus]|uniref:DUF6303 family protein n=1 Tax=Streptomyces antibioticus TaxID=1890 RepID=UPI0037247A9C